MNYDSHICSTCNCYGGFGRCLDKWNMKCKEAYSQCMIYQNKWVRLHNPQNEQNNGKRSK